MFDLNDIFVNLCVINNFYTQLPPFNVQCKIQILQQNQPRAQDCEPETVRLQSDPSDQEKSSFFHKTQ